LFEAGTSYRLNYDDKDALMGVSQSVISGKVRSPVVFDGVGIVTAASEVTASNWLGQQTYYTREGHDVLRHGFFFPRSSTGRADVTYVYSPPAREQRFSLQGVGSKTTTVYTVRPMYANFPAAESDYWQGLNNYYKDHTETSEVTTTYLGQETVTVPAGTFVACKFHVDNGISRGSWTDWVAKGKGVLVRAEGMDGSMQRSHVLTGGELNGQPL
jgi:hypothetical protein